MTQRWLFATREYSASCPDDVIRNCSPRCDASRRVRGTQQGDKRQINVSVLRATPFVHTVIRDGITRARTRVPSRGHTCARGCDRNYSRCTGYNWRASRRDANAGLNSKKCTRGATRRSSPAKNKSMVRLSPLNAYAVGQIQPRINSGV